MLLATESPNTGNFNLMRWMNHLDAAVSAVFEDMLGIPCRPSIRSAAKGDQIKVEIGLSGGIEAQCSLYFTASGAKAAALAFTGNNDLDGDAILRDAVAEIANMIIGSLKSRFDPVPPSSMTVPAVSHEHLPPPPQGWDRDRSQRGYVFKGNTMQIHVFMQGSL